MLEKELYRIITNVMHGIVMCEQDEDKKDIVYKSLNEWWFIAFKYNLIDKEGMLVAPSNETDMILNYLSIHSEDWIDRIVNQPENLKFSLCFEPLLEKISETRYVITDEGRLTAAMCLDYNVDKEQNKVFELLRRLDAISYVKVRKFIIEHPIATLPQLGKLRRILTQSGCRENFIDGFYAYCYEEIPSNAVYQCPNCQWTAIKEDEGYRCSHYRCNLVMKQISPKKINIDRGYKRVKPGINLFIVIPGLLELEIKKKCDRLNVECELWPDKDRYDCKITFENQMFFAIDAKDYHSPYRLAYELENKLSSYNPLNGIRNFIVVPDDSGRNRKDYCQVVNNKLPQNIECLTFTDLIKKVEEQIDVCSKKVSKS